MKEKGFTLIELLAVIVILAVIALIATPIIMNVINDAKKGAFKDSAYGIIKAIELKQGSGYLSLEANDNELINLTDNTLNYKGEKPYQGYAAVRYDGKIAIEMNNKNFCITKEFDEENITIKEKTAECDGHGLASINLFPYNKWNAVSVTANSAVVEMENKQLKYLSTTGLDAYTESYAHIQQPMDYRMQLCKTYGISLEEGSEYTYSVETDATAYELFVFFSDKDGNFISHSKTENKSNTFTVPAKTKYVTLRIDNEMGAGSTPTFKNLKINKVFE